jgi:putative NADH-flavin reductase
VYSGSRNTGEWPLCNYGEYRGARHSNTYALPWATINALDQLRKEPEFEWSYLSPSAGLKPGQRMGKFSLGNDQLLADANGQSKISVQDCSVAMIYELERPTHVRQRFTVGY